MVCQKAFRWRGIICSTIFIFGVVMNCAAQSGLGLITRADWFGDPYLVTNQPGNALSAFRVCLVINPALITNQDYQAKVSTLAATKVADQADVLVARFFQPAATARFEPQHPEASFRLATAPALRSPVGENDFSWQVVVQRWAVFVLAVAILTRRVWRYFCEVEEDDDFADHLSTLAVAHRWVFPVYLALLAAVAVAEFFRIGNFFCSLSVLMLAASLRRYYCEGHFADHPKAQKVHLALLCLLIWLGWMQGYDIYLSNLATWAHWHVFAWVLLALATAAFSQFYNHQDFAEHRGVLYWFALGFLFLGSLGAIGGYFFWRTSLGNDSAFWFCLGGGVLLAWCPLLVYFRKWSKKVSDEVVGRMLYDMIFSENVFAEKIRKQKHLPSVLLLRHWREHGEVEKAWQTARGHLFAEARALPVWLFALETAVLHRRQPGEALEILKRLCATEEIHFDHRTVAVAQVQGWMAAAGFDFDAASFQLERPPLPPTALTNQVEQKCREGRFGEAAILLREVLNEDCLNEPAFIQLVRLYAQDLKNRPAAEKLIADAGETFSPSLLDFLSRSLDEWRQLPIRSQVKPRKFLSWLRPQKNHETDSNKISLVSPPITSPPAVSAAEDHLTTYLERVKAAQGKPPDTALVHDRVEKLLLERRLGTAVEIIKAQAESQPENFDLWLRYAEAHGHHCGDLHAAQKIIERMERSGNFKKVQLKKAHARLKKWRKKHAGVHNW